MNGMSADDDIFRLLYSPIYQQEQVYHYQGLLIHYQSHLKAILSRYRFCLNDSDFSSSNQESIALAWHA